MGKDYSEHSIMWPDSRLKEAGFDKEKIELALLRLEKVTLELGEMGISFFTSTSWAHLVPKNRDVQSEFAEKNYDTVIAEISGAFSEGSPAMRKFQIHKWMGGENIPPHPDAVEENGRWVMTLTLEGLALRKNRRNRSVQLDSGYVSLGGSDG